MLIYSDFSKNALVTLRNGSLYLICRIADLRYQASDYENDDDVEKHIFHGHCTKSQIILKWYSDGYHW